MEGLPEKKEKHMRRTIALLTTMVLTLLVATSVVMAAEVKCWADSNVTCYGTVANDTLYGGDGRDTMFGRAGDDLIYGDAGDDLIYGDAGNDSILGMEGKDVLNGGDGKNLLGGGDGNDFHSGGVGNDTYDGGPGNDIYKDGIPANKFFSSDTYFGLKHGKAAGTGLDTVYDTGGFDVADVSTVNRSDVQVFWADSSYDADGGCDYMSIISQVPGPTQQTNAMTFFYYFDNKGGPGRGAVETIKFKDVTYSQFPLPGDSGGCGL
jgi:RTX calcium-binding nonapeptide repeat (4 copies)